MTATNQQPDSRVEEQTVSPDLIERATRVSTKVRMRHVRLAGLSAELHDVESPALTLETLGLTNRFARLSKPEGVLLKLGFEWRLAASKEQPEPKVSINAVFALMYEVPEVASFSDEDLSAFAAVNGIYNAWPFWRELLHSLTGRMGLVPVTAPTFRLIKSSAKCEKPE